MILQFVTQLSDFMISITEYVKVAPYTNYHELQNKAYFSSLAVWFTRFTNKDANIFIPMVVFVRDLCHGTKASTEWQN